MSILDRTKAGCRSKPCGWSPGQDYGRPLQVAEVGLLDVWDDGPVRAVGRIQ